MKNYHKVEFINQDHRQKYYKIPKRDRLITLHRPTPPLTPTENDSLNKKHGQNNKGRHTARKIIRKGTCYSS